MPSDSGFESAEISLRGQEPSRRPCPGPKRPPHSLHRRNRLTETYAGHRSSRRRHRTYAVAARHSVVDNASVCRELGMIGVISRRQLFSCTIVASGGLIASASAARAFSIEEPAANLAGEYHAARAAACSSATSAFHAESWRTSARCWPDSTFPRRNSSRSWRKRPARSAAARWRSLKPLEQIPVQAPILDRDTNKLAAVRTRRQREPHSNRWQGKVAKDASAKNAG